MGSDVDITKAADGSKPYQPSIGLDESSPGIFCITHLAKFNRYGKGEERSLQNECSS